MEIQIVFDILNKASGKPYINKLLLLLLLTN